MIILLSVLDAMGRETMQTDTLLNLNAVSNFIVTRQRNGVNVKIIENEGEDGENFFLIREEHIGTAQNIEEKNSFWNRPHNLYRFPSGSRNKYWSIGTDGIILGLNSANGQPSPKGLQWSKSIEIGWLSAVNIRFTINRSSFSLGIGFDWRNYRISTSGRFLTVSPDGNLNWSDFSEGIRGKGSRLKIFSIQFPLLYEYSIPSTSFTLKGGPVFNLNTHASVKTDLVNATGNSTSLSYNYSSQRLFTLDIFANISFCRTVGFFFRYSLMRVLNTNGGINFHPLTLGLSIGI